MTVNNVNGILGSMLLGELSRTNQQLAEAFERLSTGLKINSASDDPVGYVISSRLESQQRGYAAGSRNAQAGISMIQTAEGYLEGVTSDVQRIRELSVQAANGTLTDADRMAIQEEINQLRENIDFSLSSAEFNSKPLFAGNTETIMVGSDPSDTITVEFSQMDTSTLGLDQIDVTTQEGAENAISVSDDALNQVLTQQAGFGAVQNRLESSVNTNEQAWLNTTTSLSEIRDANMAEESINAMQASTKLQAQLMVASQVNNLQGIVTRMLLSD